MVLMHQGGFELTAGGTCRFVVGMKDCLSLVGFMNATQDNTGGWRDCARRKWCNNVFRNAFNESVRGIFKQFKVTTAIGTGSAAAETDDYFVLPASKEVFGSSRFANATAEASLFQLDWYKTATNIIKKANGITAYWWNRSPHSSYEESYCDVTVNGTADQTVANGALNISPFGCI